MRSRPGRPREGVLSIGGRSWPCALGRSGISRFKREGDGATPAGRLPLVTVLYRPDRLLRPATRLPVRPIAPDDGWCDASRHAAYNRPVRLPFAESHEAMWREDALYDIVVVLDWNLSRRARGRGSAIFLHIARPGFEPTEGCVAVRPADMRAILSRLGRHAELVVC